MNYAIHKYSGDFFVFGDPDQVITLRDFSVPLSHHVRFSGATRYPYTIAEHSVLVSNISRDLGHDTDVQLHALLHDAHEAFIGDLTTPFQKYFAARFNEHNDHFETIKREIDEVIYKNLKLELPDSAARNAVRVSDKLAFLVEAAQVFGSPPEWLERYTEQFIDTLDSGQRYDACQFLDKKRDKYFITYQPYADAHKSFISLYNYLRKVYDARRDLVCDGSTESPRNSQPPVTLVI
jgi:5'-deoxynucleotidase YfbR-like HD superfamily hydrolase